MDGNNSIYVICNGIRMTYLLLMWQCFVWLWPTSCASVNNFLTEWHRDQLFVWSGLLSWTVSQCVCQSESDTDRKQRPIKETMNTHSDQPCFFLSQSFLSFSSLFLVCVHETTMAMLEHCVWGKRSSVWLHLFWAQNCKPSSRSPFLVWHWIPSLNWKPKQKQEPLLNVKPRLCMTKGQRESVEWAQQYIHISFGFFACVQKAKYLFKSPQNQSNHNVSVWI